MLSDVLSLRNATKPCLSPTGISPTGEMSAAPPKFTRHRFGAGDPQAFSAPSTWKPPAWRGSHQPGAAAEQAFRVGWSQFSTAHCLFRRPGQVLEVRGPPRGSGSLRGPFLSSSSLLTGRYLRKVIDFTGAQFPEGLFGTNYLSPEKSLWEGAAGAGLT